MLNIVKKNSWSYNIWFISQDYIPYTDQNIHDIKIWCYKKLYEFLEFWCVTVPSFFKSIFGAIILLVSSPQFQIFLASLLKIVCILIAVAYFTIAERKVMGAIQRRKGPNVVGFWGLLQPLADGAKLIFKEILIPTRANRVIFLMAPIMVLVLSMVSWSLIPSGLEEPSEIFATKIPVTIMNSLAENIIPRLSNTVDIDYGVLFILAVSGLNVYGIIIAGWASNSKYAFLGALRSAAQMISYEVSLGLLILPVVCLAGSLNLSEIVATQERTGWFFYPLFPCVVMFFISMLAETNRAPFDLPEAEAELVAGYNVEYSSIIFAMFFLGEYSNMLLMGTLIVLFFFGGWLAPLDFLIVIPGSFFFSFKTVLFCYLFILVRAAVPRYRYDQLMNLGWKTLLPISLSFLVFITGILVTFDACPQVLEIKPSTYTEVYLFAALFIGVGNTSDNDHTRSLKYFAAWDKAMLLSLAFLFLLILANIRISKTSNLVGDVMSGGEFLKDIATEFAECPEISDGTQCFSQPAPVSYYDTYISWKYKLENLYLSWMCKLENIYFYWECKLNDIYFYWECLLDNIYCYCLSKMLTLLNTLIKFFFSEPKGENLDPPNEPEEPEGPDEGPDEGPENPENSDSYSSHNFHWWCKIVAEVCLYAIREARGEHYDFHSSDDSDDPQDPDGPEDPDQPIIIPFGFRRAYPPHILRYHVAWPNIYREGNRPQDFFSQPRYPWRQPRPPRIRNHIIIPDSPVDPDETREARMARYMQRPPRRLPDEIPYSAEQVNRLYLWYLRREAIDDHVQELRLNEEAFQERARVVRERAQAEHARELADQARELENRVRAQRAQEDQMNVLIKVCEVAILVGLFIIRTVSGGRGSSGK